MPYGYGWGFGFRGASPPWPYVGWGRGGLPRCWYPWAVMAPPYAPVSPYPLLTKEEEADWLKREAEAIKAELNEVEARIRDLETSK
jgi:hypothetical protein